MDKTNEVKLTTWMPATLAEQVTIAAARATIATGKLVSASEWVRSAIREKLKREAS